MTSRKRPRIGPALFALALLVSWVIVFHPDWIIMTLAERSPGVVYFAEIEEPVVALTIDDGPDPDTTPRILDILRQQDAHATFFLITSHVLGNEEVVARIVEEDHELANHLTTDEPSIKLDSAEFERRLLEAHDVLSEFSDPHWFRPGSGWYNAEMLSILHKHGYQCVLGSVYPFDPQLPSSWFAAHYVLWNAQPGSIIVLHDHGPRGERTIAALATILPELKRRGFRVVTVSELIGRQFAGEQKTPTK